LTHLFVYGSLKSNFKNKFARRLAREGTLLGSARMAGRLYRVRWYPLCYPGLRPSRQSTDWVIGELYRLRMPLRTLPVLDGYEDAQYRRVRREAVLDNGEAVRCWVYLYGRPLSEHRRIASGEYRGDC
jgi:gamma-glutamylcyclotransferase (GGCT)/AIG2-like uncharacterized protein YtfP